MAALLNYLHLPASRVIGHKEWAPCRKVDPAFWDLDQFRRAVADFMTVLATTGGTQDMALNEHDMQTLIARLLATPLPDLYPEKPTRTMTLADVLAWAAAHAGRAETQGMRANDKLDAVRADLDAVRADLDALSRQLNALRMGTVPGGPPQH